MSRDSLIKIQGKPIDLKSSSDQEKLKTYNPKTVIIAGNGAVKDGWIPYKAHLTGVKAELLPGTPGLAEYILGTPDLTIYLARYAYRYRFLAKTGAKKNEFENLRSVMDDIAEQYRQRDLELQDFPDQALNSFDPDILKDIAVVTTNWDRTLYKDKRFGSNIIQLHGLCSRPETLILPTEFSIDPHVAQRSEDSAEHSELLEALTLTHRWLSKAQYVINWGINFNPYDAELLAAAFIDYNRSQEEQDNFKYLININVDKTARDQATYVFGVPPSKRIDIDPLRGELIQLQFIGGPTSLIAPD